LSAATARRSTAGSAPIAAAATATADATADATVAFVSAAAAAACSCAIEAEPVLADQVGRRARLGLRTGDLLQVRHAPGKT